MTSKQVLLFATKSDIENIIMDIEASYPIKYCEMGLFDTRSDKYFDSVAEILISALQDLETGIEI